MLTPASVLSTAETIEEFFRRFGEGNHAAILEFFADEVDFEVAGAEYVPWTGCRSTKDDIEAFLTAVQKEVDTERFVIDRILVDGEEAVVLGGFTHVVRRTGNNFTCRFALHVTVTAGRLRLYHMFEDSHAAAEAFKE